MNNVCTILLARLGSKRLPRKHLKNFSGSTLIEFIFKRAKFLDNWPNFILATTSKPEDDELEKIALDNSKIFRDNQPFPHLIIDNFLSKKEAEIISDKFPKPGDIAWSTHGSGANSDKENFKGIKLQCSIESEFPKSIKKLMQV